MIKDSVGNSELSLSSQKSFYKELEDLGQWALSPAVIRQTSIFSWVIPRLRKSFSRFITNTWDIKTFVVLLI